MAEEIQTTDQNQDDIFPTDTRKLEKIPVEDRLVTQQSQTSIIREIHLTVKQIYKTTELNCIVGCCCLFTLAGGKIAVALMGETWTGSGKDLLEALLFGSLALLFAKVGWNIPGSQIKKTVERLTQIS